MNLRTEHLSRSIQGNNTAHDYGEGFAEETLALLPDFINDARRIETTLHEKFSDADS